jgi:hypothetical protein
MSRGERVKVTYLASLYQFSTGEEAKAYHVTGVCLFWWQKVEGATKVDPWTLERHHDLSFIFPQALQVHH